MEQKSDWAVEQKEPNDDWVYDMRGDRDRQARFLLRHNIVTSPRCQQNLCGSNCTLVRLNNSQTAKKKNKFPFRWRCNSIACGASLNFLVGSYVRGTKVTLQVSHEKIGDNRRQGTRHWSKNCPEVVQFLSQRCIQVHAAPILSFLPVRC